MDPFQSQPRRQPGADQVALVAAGGVGFQLVDQRLAHPVAGLALGRIQPPPLHQRRVRIPRRGERRRQPPPLRRGRVVRQLRQQPPRLGLGLGQVQPRPRPRQRRQHEGQPAVVVGGGLVDSVVSAQGVQAFPRQVFDGDHVGRERLQPRQQRLQRLCVEVRRRARQVRRAQHQHPGPLAVHPPLVVARVEAVRGGGRGRLLGRGGRGSGQGGEDEDEGAGFHGRAFRRRLPPQEGAGPPPGCT